MTNIDYNNNTENSLERYFSELIHINKDFNTCEKEAIVIRNNSIPDNKVLIGFSNFIEIILQKIESYPNLEVKNQTEENNILSSHQLLNSYIKLVNHLKETFIVFPLVTIDANKIIVDFENINNYLKNNNEYFLNLSIELAKKFNILNMSFENVSQTLLNNINEFKDKINKENQILDYIKLNKSENCYFILKGFYKDIPPLFDSWLFSTLNCYVNQNNKVSFDFNHLKQQLNLILTFLKTPLIPNEYLSLDLQNRIYELESDINDLLNLDSIYIFQKKSEFKYEITYF